MRKALLLALALVALGAAPAPADPLKVALAQKGFWNSSMFEFARREGFIKESGLDLDITYTQGGATTVQTVISGSVDVAIPTGTLGALSAYVKGAPLRIIAGEMAGVSDIFWYARADSGIRSIKDMAGKTIAYSSGGSSGHIALLSLLAENNIQAKPVATGGMPGTLTQVMSGQIDVGWSAPPFGLDRAQKGEIVIIARGNEVRQIKDQSVRVSIANLNSLNARRAEISKLMELMVRAVDWSYRDDRSLDDYAEFAGVSREVARRTRDEFYPRSAFDFEAVHGLEPMLKDAFQYKYIPTLMTPAQVAGLIDIAYHARK
jgi:NitT/TauT family transport system substrate-binding protein